MQLNVVYITSQKQINYAANSNYYNDSVPCRGTRNRFQTKNGMRCRKRHEKKQKETYQMFKNTRSNQDWNVSCFSNTMKRFGKQLEGTKGKKAKQLAKSETMHRKILHIDEPLQKTSLSKLSAQQTYICRPESFNS